MKIGQYYATRPNKERTLGLYEGLAEVWQLVQKSPTQSRIRICIVTSGGLRKAQEIARALNAAEKMKKAAAGSDTTAAAPSEATPRALTRSTSSND